MIQTAAQAIAHALKSLGVDVLTHVPGYGGNESFLAYKQVNLKTPFISFNEEVAYTIAHGASIAGKRSAVFMKAHGILKAANSVSDSLYTSVTAGFVTFVFDDKSGEHSDTVLNTHELLHGIGIPFKNARIESLFDDIIEAYRYSEKHLLPCALVIDSDKILKETDFNISADNSKLFNYSRNVYNHVVHPMLAKYQMKILTSKRNELDLSTVPLPIEQKFPEFIPLPLRSEALKYQTFFETFKDFKISIVTGDTTLASYYAFKPYNCIDILTYIGGSIPLAIGAYLAGHKDVWAMTGDFGFIAAGHMGLLEASQREIPLKIVIFNNKMAASTGGQQINKRLLLKIIATYENNILNIADPQNPLEISRVLKEARESKELKIVILNY